MEALTPNGTVFGDRLFKEVITVQWDHKGGAPRPPFPHARTEERPCEDRVTRQPSASQEERSHPKPTWWPLHLPKTCWYPRAWTRCSGLNGCNLHSPGLILKHPTVIHTEEESISHQVLSRAWLYLVFIGPATQITKSSAVWSMLLSASMSFLALL